MITNYETKDIVNFIRDNPEITNVALQKVFKISYSKLLEIRIRNNLYSFQRKGNRLNFGPGSKCYRCQGTNWRAIGLKWKKLNPNAQVIYRCIDCDKKNIRKE